MLELTTPVSARRSAGRGLLLAPIALCLLALLPGPRHFFAWLDAHPDVGGSNVKETYFLMDPDATVPAGPRFHQDGLAVR